ncbi:hypothetical protein PG994_011751 [Apiospora phragmitis]|uniref:Uncharacterized protein n=1 Tax=Apiospora phragmitis TaxID=2905665 RepID=A0ABR1TTP1_9PEZI
MAQHLDHDQAVDMYNQGEDFLDQTNFDNVEIPGLKFEIEPEESLEGLYSFDDTNGLGLYSFDSADGLGAGEPGPDVLADYNILQTSGNEDLFSDLLHNEQVDGMDAAPAYTQFQPQEFQSYVAPGPFNEQPAEQSGLTQYTQAFSMEAPKAFSNTNTARRSLPLSVDTGEASAYDADRYDGFEESDASIPVGEGPVPKYSPLDCPIQTVMVNDGQAHTLRRRGSTPLAPGKIRRNTRRKGDQPDPKLLSEMYYGALPPQKEVGPYPEEWQTAILV